MGRLVETTRGDSKDWDDRQKNLDDYMKSIQDANYRATDAYPGYPYSGASAAEIASIPLPKPRAQVRFFAPAAQRRRPMPLNPFAFQQMVRQHQARVRQQIAQARQQMIHGRQAAPQLIQNPFVASSGRQGFDQPIIQNPFVRSSP